MTKEKSQKSVLRYPGGKTRAVKTIMKLMPENLTKLMSPFLGGGSIELCLSGKHNVEVYAYDVFEPLVDFWQVLLESPNELADCVQTHLPLSKEKFYSLRGVINSSKSKMEKATLFYVLNRASFSGSSMSGGMSPKHPRFTQSSIDRLRNFHAPNLHVGLGDFKDTIPRHSEFMYLDPPYYEVGGYLYGNNGDAHKGFDHENLFNLLKNRGEWILSYNNHEYIRNLYNGFPMLEASWAYGMSKEKKKENSELIIFGVD